MALHTIPGMQVEYALISFDAKGRERQEGGSLMSEQLVRRAASSDVTNVFFFCHGWKGDLPAAIDQYNRWIGALMRSADLARAQQVFGNFVPLLVGLHWPSQPWGEEDLGGGSFGPSRQPVSPDRLMQVFLERLGDEPAIRTPLKVILDEARSNAAPDRLPDHVRAAYLELNRALGLDSKGLNAPPDADREGFEPNDAFDPTDQDFGERGLGGLLGPLRQLSYWTMKKRAREIGEGGAHTFLKALQEATQSRYTRVHLMGHSFGTIVVSGMVGGPNASGTLQRSIDSLVLVQGAVSLWCYAPNIPFNNAGAGYFTRVLADRKVSGPIVTTLSKHDSAVGSLYPFASRLKGSSDFARLLPEYGAVGFHGLQGIPQAQLTEQKMMPVNGAYHFAKGRVYNLESSEFIAKRGGASGAHSDIDGPEVAHAIWEAAFASR